MAAEGVAQSPAVSAEHHDESRSKVPTTNVGTCYLRMLESRKPADSRLIYDPFAERLCGPSPDAAAEWIGKGGLSEEFWVDLLAVRTKYLDDAIEVAKSPQVVILGSGLDARPWRLESLRGVATYEIDFPEVLEAKAEILRDVAPIANFRQVPANLGVEDWLEKLVAAGFKKDVPSMWILEGLVGYLTPVECDALFAKIASVTAPGSTLASTFTCRGQQATTMHRMFWDTVEDVREYLTRQGWEPDARNYWSVADAMGRPGTAETRERWTYFMATASRRAGA